MVDYTRDLRAAGLKPHEIRGRVRRGELVRLRRGIYRAPGEAALAGADREGESERNHLEAAAATMLQLRPGACLSHITAGVLHGLPVPAHLIGPVHITRPGRSGKVRPGVHLHRAIVPDEHLVATPMGPATSLARTMADLARTLAPAAAVACADVALQRVARADVLEVLGAGSRGSVRARDVMRFADAASESVGESHSRWLMHGLGLPAPMLQQKFVNGAGEFVARTDFWWPAQRLVGEFDGRVKYGRLLKPGQTVVDVIEAEKRRELALRRLGIWVARWEWSDLDDPDGFRQMLTKQLDFAARSTRGRAR